MSLSRKCHYHRPQTKPRHQKKKMQSTGSHTTTRTQLKQSNSISLPQPDFFKSRKDTMNHVLQQKSITQNPATNGRNNIKHRNKSKRLTTLKLTVAKTTWVGDLIHSHFDQDKIVFCSFFLQYSTKGERVINVRWYCSMCFKLCFSRY